jgi:hypothetical protein
LIFALGREGFWLALFIILLYIILLVLRIWINRKVNKILLNLQDLSEKEFGQLLKNYFIEKGFEIIKEKDNSFMLEKEKETIIVRYKNYQGLVDASQVRSLSRIVNQSATKGYLITTSGFTGPSWAESDNQLELINGRKLIKMFKNKFIRQQLEKGKQYG